MKLGPVFIFSLLAIRPLALSAQSQASLGVGMGVVRYAGGSSFSAFTASPAAQHLSPSSYVGASGALSLLADGVWAEQGRGDLWTAVLGTNAGPRAAISASLAASTRSDGVAAGSGAALVEALWNHFAIGAGSVTGVIEHVPGVTALRLRGRGWWQPASSPAQLSLTVEGTRFVGAWYTDLLGGAIVERPRVVASLWVTARMSAAYGSSGAASASIQYFLTPAISLEASGGNYLRDPFQGLPRAGFFAAAIRVHTGRRAAPQPQPVPPTLQPLVAQHRGGDTVVVRFRMNGAQAVAIAGSWNAWTPDLLHGLGDDIWEAALVLPPGTYYFNLVVDGSEWVVPAGVAVVSDGMGGLVAVLTVL